MSFAETLFRHLQNIVASGVEDLKVLQGAGRQSRVCGEINVPVSIVKLKLGVGSILPPVGGILLCTLPNRPWLPNTKTSILQLVQSLLQYRCMQTIESGGGPKASWH